MRFIALLTIAAFFWLMPSLGQACGATPPSFTLSSDADGNVLVGSKVLKLYVYGSSLQPQLPKVILTADSRGGALPVVIPVTLRMVAAGLLEVDLGGALIQAEMDYELSVAGAESGGGNTGYSALLRFRGVAPGPIPTELGQLVLDGRASGKIAFGGCGESAEAEQALIKLVASSAAQPWLPAAKHQLYMDGKPMFDGEIPLVDYLGKKNPTVIRALARCERAASRPDGALFEPGIELFVPAGKHRVRWASTLPNGSTLQTADLDLDLTCAGASPQTPPCCKPLVGEVDAGVALAGRPDAGTNRAGTAAAGTIETGTPVDAAALAESDSPSSAGSKEDDDRTAACTLGVGQRCGALGWLLFIALFVLHARGWRRGRLRRTRARA